MRSVLTALIFSVAALLPATGPVTLHEAGGRKHVVALTNRVTVVVFVSALCPISNEYVDRMIALYRDFSPRGVGFVFVNSNVNETDAEVRDHAAAAGFPFPVYRDHHNALADRLKASVTPEVFLLDRTGSVRYQGAVDDARNPARVKVPYLKEGIEALLSGRPAPRSEAKATGCTIKRERKAS